VKAPDLRLVLPLAGLVLGAVFLAAVLIDRGPPAPVGVALDGLKKKVFYLEEEKIFLTPTREGFLALVNDSQHLRHEVFFCPTSKMFEAPAHGEIFDRYGRYYAGPAASDMNRVESFVEGTILYLDPAEVVETPNRSKTALEPAGKLCLASKIPVDPNTPGFFAATD